DLPPGPLDLVTVEVRLLGGSLHLVQSPARPDRIEFVGVRAVRVQHQVEMPHPTARGRNRQRAGAEGGTGPPEPPTTLNPPLRRGAAPQQDRNPNLALTHPDATTAATGPPVRHLRLPRRQMQPDKTGVNYLNPSGGVVQVPHGTIPTPPLQRVALPRRHLRRRRRIRCRENHRVRHTPPP